MGISDLIGALYLGRITAGEVPIPASDGSLEMRKTNYGSKPTDEVLNNNLMLEVTEGELK